MPYTDRPFIWGQDDCSLFLADWWQHNHGVDHAAHLRGTYHDKATKDAVLARAGGLLNVVQKLAKAAAATPTKNPEAGDFGVIYTGNREPIGGICAGAFWAIRNEQVGFLSSPRVLRAWKID